MITQQFIEKIYVLIRKKLPRLNDQIVEEVQQNLMHR